MSETTPPAPPTDRTISAAEAQKINLEAHAADDLLIWCITTNTTDRPGQFVARPHSVRHNRPLTAALSAATYDDLIAQLPPGLIKMPRSVFDDPVIVESWM
jgi:hypothetical protein